MLNSERVLSNVDNDFVISTGIDGDFNFGNLNLIQVNISTQFGKKINKDLFRGVFNYSYNSEDKEVLSDDWTGQLRWNHFRDKNSIFAFLQGQNVKTLKLKYRYLYGGGYRFRTYSRKENYVDTSLGIFKEHEQYEEINSSLKVDNLRYSLSSFSKFHISNSILFENTIYLQINTRKLDDYRIYFEPRISFIKSENIEFFITTRNRYHSTPYIDVMKNDNQSSIGIQITN
jgi:hypothetical protein